MRSGADEDAPLELAEAARELGVHYQTAYRWVREGELRAVKVGKSYRVERRDLDRFSQRRARGAAPRPIQVRDWGHQIERLREALRRGDERSAGELVDRLANGGVSPVELCDELLAPALRLIGEDWASGEATVADEHRATAICERLLARLPTRRTRVRGTVVVATPAGEHHALPALMASIALRYDGWRVHHLSSDLPADELAAFLERERPDLLVLSTTMPGTRAGSVARRAATALGIPVMVGAPGKRLDDLLGSARDP
jgi:MerR family transcriptional regulator, light-induced transcriptional regulator